LFFEQLTKINKKARRSEVFIAEKELLLP